MIGRWRVRNPRERSTLAGGALLLALLLICVAVIEPLDRKSARARERLVAEQAALAELRAIVRMRDRTSTGGMAPGTERRSVFAVVNGTAVEAGLAEALQRLVPDGKHGLTVSLAAAEFDALVAWLWRLEDTFGVRVRRASLGRGATPGFVEGSLALHREARPGRAPLTRAGSSRRSATGWRPRSAAPRGP